MATAERRRHEREADRKALGILCGGFLCCLCIGTDRAAQMGTNCVDTLLCMNSSCWGF
jgi:hypothetical protein